MYGLAGACIVLLCKGKGDMYECYNSRGVCLLSIVGKRYGQSADCAD